MSVRLPSAHYYEAQVDKEHEWLPKIAPHLPLSIPVPLAKGSPGEGYPFRWSIYRWLEGEPASRGGVSDKKRFAIDLVAFLTALQKIDATGGPLAGEHNFHRGGSLTVYDAETRRAVAALKKEIDCDEIMSVWKTALATKWQLRPVWVHGDIAEGNLLVRDGRLAAVIDFGSSGVGDPASDLYIAWTFLDGESRDVFRAALPLDRATWERGRGWTLWKALITRAEYGNRNILGATAKWVIEDVLADHKRSA